MAEGMNVEVAHKLTEQRTERRNARWQGAIGIIEVALLALVAITTAWSGYQAAKWDGQQSEFYGHATTYRFKADAASTYGGQLLAGDSSIFTAYLQAHAAGDAQLEQLYIRRFTPDYKTAFVAWLRTDPFTNPSAPAGPGVMPQYHNPYFASAASLNAQASATFDNGTSARDTAERYIRDTVLFASVLFLVAVAQRFDKRELRIATIIIAFVLAAYTCAAVLTLPII